MRVSPTHILRCGKCDEEHFLGPLYGGPSLIVGGLCYKCGNTCYRGIANRFPFVLIERPVKNPPPVVVAMIKGGEDMRKNLDKIMAYIVDHPWCTGDTISKDTGLHYSVVMRTTKELFVKGSLQHQVDGATGKKFYPHRYAAADVNPLWPVTATTNLDVPKPDKRPLKAEKQGTGHVLVPRGRGIVKGPYIVWVPAGASGDDRLFAPQSYESLDQVKSDLDSGILMSSMLLTKRVGIAVKIEFAE